MLYQAEQRPFYFKRWFFLVLWIIGLTIWIRHSVQVPKQEFTSNLALNEEIIPASDEALPVLNKVENVTEAKVKNEEQGVIVEKQLDSNLSKANTETKIESPVVEVERTQIKESEKKVTEPPLDAVLESTPKQEKVSNLIEGTVKEGETLSLLLKRYELNTPIRELLRTKEGSALNHLRVGHKFILERSHNSLVRLVYEVDSLTTLEWKKQEGKWVVKENRIIPIEEVKTVTGKVGKSIYLSGKKLGISPRLIQQFVDAFSSQVNFSAITANDQFMIVFKRYTVGGKVVKPDEMMAAEIIHRGETYRIIGFRNDAGQLSFYTPDGVGVKPSFLRYPLTTVKRVSSHFNLHRRHPVYNTIRPHYGVDLVADLGTPVLAASSGSVSFVGTRGGYGRTVVIKHDNHYTTLYAHLYKFAPKVTLGKKVRQGEVIGYVGSSGISTSPHLHYEVRVKDVPKDPLKMALPKMERIASNKVGRFTVLVKHYEEIFDSMKTPKSERFFVLTNEHNQG